jgi:AcrR family transcriptional regulator
LVSAQLAFIVKTPPPEGTSPTVERAADRAGISRTTAYRYFTNQRELVVACYPETEASTLLPRDASKDPRERLAHVTERIGRSLLDHEAELRAMLRLSLGTTPVDDDTMVLRRGRAIGWLEDALSPLRPRMKRAELRRLVLSIRAAIGIEPMVWLTDIAGLSREAAVELMRSSAHTLLEAALRGLAKA